MEKLAFSSSSLGYLLVSLMLSLDDLQKSRKSGEILHAQLTKKAHELKWRRTIGLGTDRDLSMLPWSRDRGQFRWNEVCVMRRS